MPLASTKRCRTCERDLPREAFTKGKADCRPCRNARIKTQGVTYYNRSRWIEKQYGLTSDDEAALLAAQNHQCAICSGSFDPWPSIDHDHNTGEIRGLLCLKCNTMLGGARDSAAILRAALRYLSEPPARAVLAEPRP
jgi:hypothetical protein